MQICITGRVCDCLKAFIILQCWLPDFFVAIVMSWCKSVFPAAFSFQNTTFSGFVGITYVAFGVLNESDVIDSFLHLLVSMHCCMSLLKKMPFTKFLELRNVNWKFCTWVSEYLWTVVISYTIYAKFWNDQLKTYFSPTKCFLYLAIQSWTNVFEHRLQ
jgi:hypothetical protein